MVGYKVSLGNREVNGTAAQWVCWEHYYCFFDHAYFAFLGAYRELPGLEEVEGKNYHNLFQKIVDVSSNPLIVILYVVGCISGYIT